jgi:hypothetical protein
MAGNIKPPYEGGFLVPLEGYCVIGSVNVMLSLCSKIFQHPAVSEPGLDPDAQAAVDAVRAFYTLDYTISPESWILNVCVFATDQGCNAIRSFFAPTIQTHVQNYQIQTGCYVLPIRMIEDDGDFRKWQVRVTLDHPWSGLEAPAQEFFRRLRSFSGSSSA